MNFLFCFAGCECHWSGCWGHAKSCLMRLKSSVLLNPDYSILGFHDPSLTAVECGEARSLAGNNHVHQCKTGPGEAYKENPLDFSMGFHGLLNAA